MACGSKAFQLPSRNFSSTAIVEKFGYVDEEAIQFVWAWQN
jgi:hypothetical protein